jgi:hypothetical protein
VFKIFGLKQSVQAFRQGSLGFYFSPIKERELEIEGGEKSKKVDRTTLVEIFSLK